MTLQQLIERRNAALARARELNAQLEAAAEPSAEVQEAFEAATAEAEGLNEQFEALQATEREALARRARMQALEAAVGAPQPRQVPGAGPVPDARVRPAIADDPLRGFRSIGELGSLLCTQQHPSGGIPQGADERLRFLAAVSGSSAGEGASLGVLLPPAMSQAIWDRMRAATDNLMSLCDRYTVEGDSLTLLANAENSRANGKRWGGVEAKWRAEGDQMAGSKPKLRQVKLEPHELYVLCYVTDKLLRGSGQALTQLLERAATEEILFKVNDAIVEGTGVGQPLGFLKSPARVVVAKEAAQAADTVVAANINKIWSRFFAPSRANGRWLINQDVEPELETLKIDVGTGGQPLFIPPGGLSEAPYGRLKARPVQAIEYASTLGDEGDVSLVDLSAYALGVKGSVESAMSIHLRFDFGETAFRFTFEVDGQPWPNKPLTPFKGTATLSPFVTLAARA